MNSLRAANSPPRLFRLSCGPPGWNRAPSPPSSTMHCGEPGAELLADTRSVSQAMSRMVRYATDVRKRRREIEAPGLVTVSMAFAGTGAFVGSGSYVLGHLGLQDLLHHPLDDLAQEARVVEQDPLR
jgi:hypothetical protein